VADRPVIANHQSPVDIPVMIGLFGRFSVRFVTRPGLDRWIPAASFCARTQDYVVLKKGDAAGNLKRLRENASRLPQGHGFVIYAEGRKTAEKLARRRPPVRLDQLTERFEASEDVVDGLAYRVHVEIRALTEHRLHDDVERHCHRQVMKVDLRVGLASMARSCTCACSGSICT
jgi:1-acyl-sn-glycerol-3-phosphate acyltransferase